VIPLYFLPNSFTQGDYWMPRRKGSASTASAIRQFRRQAGSVLAKLRKDIRAKEIELAQLKRDEESLGRLAGRGGAGGGGARAPRAARGDGGGGGGRINWRNVLAQLPKQFKASNVRQVRGLKDKRPSEIFAAITRWIEAGLAKRKTRGLYEKA
jgi:hypothetical protein